MQYLMDYEDKKFQNVSKEGLKLGKDSKDKELKESFKDLTKWWKNSLSNDNVDDVKISNRLDNTPCVVVTSKFGWSANMERIMQSQTLSDASKQAYMRGKRVLEINPRHPIIKELRERVVKNPEVHYKFEFLYCLIFSLTSLSFSIVEFLVDMIGMLFRMRTSSKRHS
jgi:heat shock protein beta